MKRILLCIWMAVAALVFSSCGGRSDVENPTEGTELRFDIQVDSIEATEARIHINPSDTVSTYYWNVFIAASVAGISDDSIRKEMSKDMKEWLKSLLFDGYDISYTHLLSRGGTTYRYKDLASNTDYVVLAVAMNDSVVASGPIAKKYFTTLPVKEDSVVIIAANTAKLHDWTKVNGTFMLMSTTDQGMFVSISVFSKKLEGTFTSKDMDQTASYITIKSSYDILELEFTGKKEDENYIYEGWFIAKNMVKYRFRFICPRQS